MTLDEAKTEIGKLCVNLEDAARLLAVHRAVYRKGTDTRERITQIIVGLETAARNARKLIDG